MSRKTQPFSRLTLHQWVEPILSWRTLGRGGSQHALTRVLLEYEVIHISQSGAYAFQQQVHRMNCNHFLFLFVWFLTSRTQRQTQMQLKKKIAFNTWEAQNCVDTGTRSSGTTKGALEKPPTAYSHTTEQTQRRPFDACWFFHKIQISLI